MEYPEPASPPVDDGPRVIRIMPDSAYAVLVPDDYPKSMLHAMVSGMEDWQRSGAQFIILQGVKLVRLNGPAPEEGTSDPDGA